MMFTKSEEQKAKTLAKEKGYFVLVADSRCYIIPVKQTRTFSTSAEVLDWLERA